MQLRQTVSLTIGGVWGAEPDGIDDLAVVRVADFDMESLTARSVVPTQRRIEAGQRGRRLLRPGDLLLEKSGGGEKQNVGRVVQWTGQQAAVCSNFVNILRPVDWCDSRFLTYLHRSLYGIGWPNACTKQTTGIQNLDVGAYLRVPVLELTCDAQRRVADFLDGECARANEALRQREAVHSGVLRSMWSPIDDLVRSAPTQRLKFWLHGIVDTEHATCPTYDDGTIPVVRTPDVRDGTLRLGGALRTDESGWRQWTRRRVPRTGDVVFTREAPIGEAAVVPPNTRLCIGQRSVLLLIVREKAFPHFVVASLYSRSARDEIDLRGRSTTTAHLNVGEIGELPVPDLPIDQQEAVVGAVRRRREAVAQVTSVGIEFAEALTAYRASLIHEAVTGKLDVTQVSDRQMAERLHAASEGRLDEVPV